MAPVRGSLAQVFAVARVSVTGMARMRRLLLLLVVVALALPAEAALAPAAGAAGKAGALAAKKKKKASKCTKAKKKKKSRKADAAAKKKSKKKATCKKKKKKKKAKGPNLVPRDYRQIKGLSQPTYTDVATDVVRLPMADGVEIYLEITKPKAPGRYGVILEASGYHGTLYERTGTRILPGPTKNGEPIGLKGYFPPRGYAVVMMDVRGTGKSAGCLDHIGPKDMSDMKAVIEWATSQPWSNGRAGILGHSYVGATSIAAVSTRAKGLVTAVVSAGVGVSMYDHQFQAGVPYNLQWAGPIEAYEELALYADLPPELSPVTGSSPTGGGPTGDNWPNSHPEETGCGMTQSAIVTGADQLSGRFAQWHAERTYTEASKNDIPVFVIHGENDHAARVIALDWFTPRGGKPGDKLWLGQWDHGIGCCPNQRRQAWTAALHAWFDKQILQRNVDTGAPVEVYLNDAKTVPEAFEARKEIFTAPTWPPPHTTFSLYPADGGAMSESKPGAGSASFSGDPQGYVSPGSPGVTGNVTFSTPAATQDRVFIGVPELEFTASVTMPRVHLIANLYDESSDGSRRRVTQCAINPELRDSLETLSPVIPGQQMKLKPPCFPMSHHLRKGHKWVLSFATSDDDKVPLFAIDPNVTIFTGGDATVMKLPQIQSPKLYPDTFPLGQQTAVGTA
jgi:predicted acyl esterase